MLRGPRALLIPPRRRNGTLAATQGSTGGQQQQDTVANWRFQRSQQPFHYHLGVIDGSHSAQESHGGRV